MAIDRNSPNAQSPNGEAARPSSEAMQEMEAMGREDEAVESALLMMLIEDARSGTVKDPKKRNIKGRSEKRSKLGRPTIGASSTERAEPKVETAPDNTSEAALASSSAIKSASSSLNKLGAITKPGEKGLQQLLDRHNFV